MMKALCFQKFRKVLIEVIFFVLKLYNALKKLNKTEKSVTNVLASKSFCSFFCGTPTAV